MARDPVCGMSVEETKAAAKTEYQGMTFYFCSASCHKSFVANPKQYLKTPPPRSTDDPKRGH